MRRFERLADGLFPQLKKDCPSYLRHKMCLISPHILRQNSIPYNKVVQHTGEIMITFPCGYHSGFNSGFNIAEAVNFAIEPWLKIANKARACECIRDSVKIDMLNFKQNLYRNCIEGDEDLILSDETKSELEDAWRLQKANSRQRKPKMITQA